MKDASGNVVEVHCSYDPATRGGNTPDGRKVKSTIQWVSAERGVDFEARLYENLFRDETAEDEGKDFIETLNQNSLTVKTGKIEPAVRDSVVGGHYQFERVGYFCMDRDSTADRPIFNRTVQLKDTWAKIEKGQQQKK